MKTYLLICTQNYNGKCGLILTLVKLIQSERNKAKQISNFITDFQNDNRYFYKGVEGTMDQVTQCRCKILYIIDLIETI